MAIKAHDLSGTVYGALTVIERVPHEKRGIRWRCRCECGVEKNLYGAQLRQGKTVSCGCLLPQQARERALRHGMTRSPEHRSWSSMNSRCNNPKHHAFSYYGGRGIKVCERWKSFEIFLQDMGPRPSLQHSLDRIDNDKGYSPDNCRWATAKEQRLNNSMIRLVEIDGEAKRLMEWSHISGIPFDVLFKRLAAGWDPKRAITQPRRITKPRRPRQLSQTQ